MSEFKFKAGDRVRVTSVWAEHGEENAHQIGWEGTVTKVNDTFPYRVRMDKQTEDFDWHMFEEELELVSEG